MVRQADEELVSQRPVDRRGRVRFRKVHPDYKVIEAQKREQEMKLVEERKGREEEARRVREDEKTLH